MDRLAIRASALGLALGFTSVTASADVGVNPRASTLGLGVEISKGFGKSFSVGLAVNAISVDFDDSSSGLDYNFDIDLQTFGVLANYHPFEGVFRITAGIFRNDNEFELKSKFSPGTSYTVGNQTFTASSNDSLSGKLTFKSTAPYLGIGWGSRPGSSFGLTADIGVLYQGSPKLSMNATGVITAANLEIERQQVEEDLKDFKWYPVVGIGLYYRF